MDIYYEYLSNYRRMHRIIINYVYDWFNKNIVINYLNYRLIKCLSVGEGLSYLLTERKDIAHRLLPHVKVFARVNPKQKEVVITTLKYLGREAITLIFLVFNFFEY